MTYYKIIRDGEAVDAGFTFLTWNERHKTLMVCEPEKASYVQSYDTRSVYRVMWLNPAPEGAPAYPVADVRIIDAEEYEDLRAALDDGETVPEPDDPEPQPEPEPEPDPEPEPERRMTVQEMREKIAELTARVMNEAAPFTAAKTYQTGEIITDGARVYIANTVIVKGETVKPGENCAETTIADVLNAIQAEQE